MKLHMTLLVEPTLGVIHRIVQSSDVAIFVIYYEQKSAVAYLFNIETERRFHKKL